MIIFKRYKKLIKNFIIGLTCLSGLLAYFTVSDLKSAPQSFENILARSDKFQILDRFGEPLNITYQNEWNIHNIIPLHEIPTFLKKAFIISEDKRFYDHSGPDWQARFSALFTNIVNLKKVRGASTITEQTIRMIHPRPRTIWSRWLEGFEANQLENKFSKQEILEFYLNQIPYASNRRGISQAARYYFNRNIDTLSKKEILALVVLVRAPGKMDLWKSKETIQKRINFLSKNLMDQNLLTLDEYTSIKIEKFELQKPHLSTSAFDFITYVKNNISPHYTNHPYIKTTLNSSLQNKIQKYLDNRLKKLSPMKVHNGAVLVVDHSNGDILSWVVAGKDNQEIRNRFINAVVTPRQPGSALKPFLYSLALEKGWTAATIIEDSQLSELVGHGLHHYKNYSHTFYGPITLRQALGNSLNIPALKTLQFIGAENYLSYLKKLGFHSLNQHPNIYGDGIALGNGEVTLYELVQAYSVLANQGRFRPLKILYDDLNTKIESQIISPEIASLMGHILSDPQARKLEFGENSVLNLDIQTAVKTGTSNDYRDSWAMGYNYKYTVGIWMGNLDQVPTNGVTGSIGPGLLLRSIFSELNRNKETKPLYFSSKLEKHEICDQTNLENHDCKIYSEWFLPHTNPKPHKKVIQTKKEILLRRPSHGLHIALDPRIPKNLQFFEFFIEGVSEHDKVIWNIDKEKIHTKGSTYNWPLEKGEHEVEATVFKADQEITLKKISFLVK